MNSNTGVNTSQVPQRASALRKVTTRVMTAFGMIMLAASHIRSDAAVTVVNGTESADLSVADRAFLADMIARVERSGAKYIVEVHDMQCDDRREISSSEVPEHKGMLSVTHTQQFNTTDQSTHDDTTENVIGSEGDSPIDDMGSIRSVQDAFRKNDKRYTDLGRILPSGEVFRFIDGENPFFPLKNPTDMDNTVPAGDLHLPSMKYDIPEPRSSLLIGAGMVAFLSSRRRAEKRL